MISLFENISEKNILKLKHILMSTTSKYPKGVNILSNVNRDDFIVIIDSGSIDLIYTDYEGNKTVLEELQKGEMFGSLTSSLHSEEITCMTKEETQITIIEYDQITNDEIITSDFYIIFIKNLIRILIEQISNRNNRIELLTKKTTRDKLLAYFQKESQKKGNKAFSLQTPFTEIASYLSVDRSAMTRELKYLKEEGFIEINGKKVTIHY